MAKLAEARSAVSQFDTASRRRSDAKNLPSERVNARDHIAEAAEGSTLTFMPEQMVQQDKELRTVKRRLESITGRKVYYTLGGIKRTGADGKIGTARGAITPDGIYLRCDDDSASVTQLAGHELYHYYEEQFPGLHDRVRQKITERYSEEKFREVAGRYAEKLGRLNGMAEDMDAESYEAMLRRIESEIFADAFGNINYFRLGADRYTDAARETVNETLGSETAAATDRRTGPPTQFSEGESLQERIDRAIELLDNDTPASKVFRETGLIAMAGGQLQDGFGGEIVGRYSRGGNNEGRVVPSGPYDGTDGRKAGRGVEKGAEKTAGKLGAWETLDSGTQGRITKRITEQMKGATEEGQEFFGMFNSPEEFAQRFYGMLQQDRVVAEQWAHLIPNIDALMDELENIGAKETSFSASEDTDAEYMAAAESGDIETAQRMVDEAAKAAGYSRRMWHGAKKGKNFTVFKGWSYFTENQKYAERYTGQNPENLYGVYAKIEHPFDTRTDRKARRDFESAREEYGMGQLGDRGLPDWTDGYDIVDYIEENGKDYDAVILDEGGDLVNGEPVYRGESYVIRDSAQVKSADPVTYDDDGKIIPLSERFNPEKQDIRWSMTEDEDIPESAAEYSRQRYREENREPQSAAEYSQMKQRALEREAEIRKLEKKGEASAEDRREAAWARREFEAPKEKANKQQATIAKKDLRNTIINEFGIPDGRKAEIGKLIDAYADQAYKDGKLTETDRQALFDKLYSEGVMIVPADDAFQAAREIIKGGRVYVPESVKHEFGDDWGSFRREAFAEGILLTNNESDMRWDSWNVELSAELPGAHPLIPHKA